MPTPGEILPPDQNLSEKQLKFGYWFVTHKIQLKKILEVVLMVVSAALLLFTVGMLVKLYLIDYNRDRETAQSSIFSLVNPAAIKAELPVALVTTPVQIYDAEKGTVDVATEITNPNKKHSASWTGQFVGANTTTTKKMEFILPGETKTVVDLGLDSPTRMQGARYIVDGLSWHKVDAHAIPDYAFEVTSSTFASALSPDGKSTVSHVSFIATNHSAYNYWTVKFIVKLYRGDAVAAINSVELQQFTTGETRPVDLVWVQDLAAISKVEVVPQVNILDPQSFMPQQSGTQ